MAEQRSERLLSKLEEQAEKKFARYERIMEIRGRAAAPATASSVTTVSVQHTSAGTLMRSPPPELNGRDNLGISLMRLQF